MPCINNLFGFSLTHNFLGFLNGGNHSEFSYKNPLSHIVRDDKQKAIINPDDHDPERLGGVRLRDGHDGCI